MLIHVSTNINPQPWAVGSAYAFRRGAKYAAGISPNAKLQTYQKALQEDVTEGHTWGFGLKEDLDFPLFPSNQELVVRFLFWRQIEKVTTSSGRTTSGNYADTTNLQKATEDALQGIFYKNDRNNRIVMSEIVSQDAETVPSVVIISGSLDCRDQIINFDREAIYALREAKLTDLQEESSTDRNAW